MLILVDALETTPSIPERKDGVPEAIPSQPNYS
jgi:hypothetical protein